MILCKPSYEIASFVGLAMLRMIEEAGRTCYKSEDRITNESAEKFCKSIISRGHESVIEHVSLSVRFVANRGFTHELVRHRLASYSQESTRYCNYKGGVTFVIPPWVVIEPGRYTNGALPPPELASRNYPWFRHITNSETEYQTLLENGWSPQQARGVLPIDLKTEIVMTANVREWRHVFKLRCSKAAHPQMRELMIPLRDELKAKIPILFDDLCEEN